VDWGHLPKWERIRDRHGDELPEGLRVRMSSGMTGVIPCWTLKGFLDSEEFVASRTAQEKEALMGKEAAGVLDVDVFSATPPRFGSNRKSTQD